MKYKYDIKTNFFSFRYNMCYSTSSLTPVVIYSDLNNEKAKLLKDNNNKAGIYRWRNKINGKTYIGSSINLTKRFYKYISLNNIQKIKTPIYGALLKYGIENFTLEILEYCDEDSVINREQYYLDTLSPEYNILKIAGSSLGFKHSEKTLEFFKTYRVVEEETKKNLSQAATGRVLSEEVKDKISKAHIGKVLSEETKTKISKARTLVSGVPVKVIDTLSDKVTEYENITEASKILGVSRTSIKNALTSGKLLKKQYLIKSK
jgi:group I intron endonuclease